MTPAVLGLGYGFVVSPEGFAMFQAPAQRNDRAFALPCRVKQVEVPEAAVERIDDAVLVSETGGGLPTRSSGRTVP